MDDIRLLNECPSQSERFCDFEVDMCGYSSTGDFEWKRGSIDTTSNGPETDHTTQTNTGSFVYANGTSNTKELKASLISQVITPNSEQCLEFYYFNKQQNKAAGLQVSYWLSTASSNLPLWTEPKFSNGINGWRLSRVPLGHSLTTNPYQIIIEEVVAASNEAKPFDIYIDDIYIKDHSCLPAGDCDFEDGFCNFLMFTFQEDLDQNLNLIFPYPYPYFRVHKNINEFCQ